jgi:hypothetical protein
MNDLLSGIVTVGTVLTFGLLISIGSERQRRAIDALHQAYRQWALQDLRLKRRTASAQTRIDDLTVWLTKVTSLAFGRKMIALDHHVHHTPLTAVEFHDAEAGVTVVCALESPAIVRAALRRNRPVLRGEVRSNPLFRVSKKTLAVELSVLNAGTMFDVELPVAWNGLTGQSTESDTLWAYILS